MFNTCKLYLGENCRYPLWLTRSLLLFVGGARIVSLIDWNRSTRYYLVVRKRAAAKVMDVHFFYPDGELFGVKTEEEVDEMLLEEVRDEGLGEEASDFWPTD